MDVLIDKPIGAISIGFAWVGFITLIFCFFYFCYHKKKYQHLLKMYHQKGFDIRSPYTMYSSSGFLGSFGMSYFFSRIRRNKKVLFIQENSKETVKFLNSLDPAYTKWLDIYYMISKLLLFLYLSFAFLAVVQILIIKL